MVDLLMSAIEGSIDKYFKQRTPDFLKDMRAVYRKALKSNVAGDAAYNAEIIRRSEIQKAVSGIRQLLKDKFKDIKDSPEQLFRAAESIKVTKDGVPEYGTHKYLEVFDKKDIKAAQENGYTFLRRIFRDGKDGVMMSKERYSPEESKRIFNELSPEGQQLIKDFTAVHEQHKDEFNREVLKQMYNIESNLEGWVHHFFKGKPMVSNSRATLKTKKAAAQKFRTDKEGYVEDFQLATEKAMVEMETTKINNEFLQRQLARISKPIATGNKADTGWTEVIYDKKYGLRLPGESRESIIIQTEYLDDFGDPSGEIGSTKKFMKPVHRYQIPTVLVEHYRTVRGVPEEISRTSRVMKRLGTYWTINVLFHPGTTATNYFSGAIQYSAYISDNFWRELVSGQFTFDKTRRSMIAPFVVLTPKGWSNVPDWMFGGYRSSMAGLLSDKTSTDIAIDNYGDKALKVFGMVESYWKKAIVFSEAGDAMKPLARKKAYERLRKDEKALISQINQVVDFYAYDYDNKPLMLQKWDRSGTGRLIKPFATYPYKYYQMVGRYLSAPFEKSLPWETRLARTLTISTLMLAIQALNDEEEETPQGSDKTPYQLRPGGRMFTGMKDDEGREIFVRTAKYPFFNITSVGESIVKGEFKEVEDMMREQFGTIGILAELSLVALGRKSQFEQYKPTPAILGDRIASFIPGFRIFNDIGLMIDPVSRSQETFIEGVGSKLPIWGSEEQRAKLRGDRRTLSVPIEPEKRLMTSTAKESYERDLTREREDILLSFLAGIYTSRISPEEAKQQELREIRNKAEAEIRTLLLDGNQSDAYTMAEEYGFTISDRTFD